MKRRLDAARPLILATTGLAAWWWVSLAAAAPAEAERAWQEPFHLTLPEATRTIALRPGADPAAFAARHGIRDARPVPMGRSGSLLEVVRDDEAWRSLREAVCSDGDVASCETAVCQSIQLTGDATPGSGHSAEAIRARLVRDPPERVNVPDEPTGEPGTCKGPPAVPLLEQAAAETSPGGNLDLTLLDTDRAPPRAPAAHGRPVPAEADGQAAPAEAADPVGALARRSFEFEVAGRFNPAGGVNLVADELPADTSDWTLVVGAGCTEVKVPLDAIEPARLPGQVVALVGTADVGAVASDHGLTVIRQTALPSTGQNLVVYATTRNVVAAITAMAMDARVDGAQPEHVFETTAAARDSAAAPAGGTRPYSDPFAALNYGPGMTGALALHPSARGAGQLVAVIDTGVDANHPDLAGRLREPVDTTDTGYSAEVHGTAVAGIIAASVDNAIGTYGVAPAAEILPIQACRPKEAGGLAARCTTSSLVKALDVAITAGAHIINMSLAGPPDELLSRFVALALQQDRLVVAGAGNGGPHARPAFPAAIPGVLAVTAVDVTAGLYPMANHGDYIDVAAPGVDIVSTTPSGRYPPLSGTSMAAAHTSGVAALLGELGPLMTPREVGLVIRGNARDLGTPGTDPDFGAGLVDACRAAAAATADAVTCTGREAHAAPDAP